MKEKYRIHLTTAEMERKFDLELSFKEFEDYKSCPNIIEIERIDTLEYTDFGLGEAFYLIIQIVKHQIANEFKGKSDQALALLFIYQNRKFFPSFNVDIIPLIYHIFNLANFEQDEFDKEIQRLNKEIQEYFLKLSPREGSGWLKGDDGTFKPDKFELLKNAISGRN